MVLGQGQVPCEFQADWTNFIFQLVAPDAPGNEPLGSETSKLLHQTGECVLSQAWVEPLAIDEASSWAGLGWKAP